MLTEKELKVIVDTATSIYLRRHAGAELAAHVMAFDAIDEFADLDTALAIEERGPDADACPMMTLESRVEAVKSLLDGGFETEAAWVAAARHRPRTLTIVVMAPEGIHVHQRELGAD
jgi:hypothetical protein